MRQKDTEEDDIPLLPLSGVDQVAIDLPQDKPGTPITKSPWSYRIKLLRGWITTLSVLSITWVVLFCVYFARYYARVEVREAAGIALCFAKGFAGTLYVSVSLLFATMCRRATGWLFSILPMSVQLYFHDIGARRLHRIAGIACALGAAGHVISHLLGTLPNLASVEEAALVGLLPNLIAELNGRPTSVLSMLFSTRFGITGIIMCLSLIYMALTARQSIRHQNFELFAWVHSLLWLFIIAFLAHGTADILQTTEAWRWTGLFVALYAIDRAFSLFQGRRSFVVKHISWSRDGRLCALEFSCPPGVARPSLGQYLQINHPLSSAHQWHPFLVAQSLSAAKPHHIRVVIARAGDWTTGLLDAAECQGSLQLRSRGPFGSPVCKLATCAGVDRVVVLSWAGSGAAPFFPLGQALVRGRGHVLPPGYAQVGLGNAARPMAPRPRGCWGHHLIRVPPRTLRAFISTR